jgi:proteasome lid subunit RPN8/RPN11
MTFILTDRARAQIIAIGKSRAPREACGLLLVQPPPTIDPIVVEIPNQSLSPENSYEFTAKQARAAAQEFLDSGVEIDDVVVWHTHPSGRTGPSQKDMEVRDPSIKYIVFTLNGVGVRY